MNAPLVFDINSFSLDDGPGIRAAVFLKGCPLSCAWCHNPESWSTAVEIAFYRERCIGCGDCVSVCSERAASLELPGRIDRMMCTSCGTCALACPAAALKTVGRHYPPDTLAALVLKNRLFYEASGGGVTFSGGEPTLHMRYLKEVMHALKAEEIHIAIQTSGLFDIQQFSTDILPFVDVIHYDLKVMDPVTHRMWTGADNGAILANFRRLAATAHDRIVPRMPLIPGMTATRRNVSDTYDFIRDAGYEKLVLLSYNPAGREKRRRLGLALANELPESTSLSVEEEQGLRQLCNEQTQFIMSANQGDCRGEDRWLREETNKRHFYR